jgi:hypothetical protein
MPVTAAICTPEAAAAALPEVTSSKHLRGTVKASHPLGRRFRREQAQEKRIIQAQTESIAPEPSATDSTSDF